MIETKHKVVSHKADEIALGKRIARSQFSFIVGAKKDRRRAYYRLKNTLEYPALCAAADFVDRNIPENFRELMFGNALPKSYKELGKCDFSYTTEHFINEINWTLISIRKYAYQINLFLVYKELYETNLLLGDYEEAEKYLDKIEQEICFSLWTLENRFLIKEYNGSSADSKDFLSQFNEENQSDAYTKSLAHYLSLRAERTLSVNRFNADLELALSKIQGDKKQEHIDYYLFKLSFLNHLKFTNYVEIIAYDFQHSVIDRYLNLRKVLINLLTTANQMVEKVEDGKTIKAYVLNRINYLIRKINDPTLFKLKLFASEKLFPAFDEAESKAEVSIIDKYTTGFYQEAEEELRELLLKKPTQFDLYDLYVKSLIYQKKPFATVGNSKSIQNQILHEMYRIVSVSMNPTEAGINLLRIANNITSCVLSYGIADFVFHQTKGKEERKLLARLCFNAANPAINEIYTDTESQLNYLEFLKTKFPTSITIDFFLNKIQNIDNISFFEKKLPDVKYKTELAKALQRKNDFEGAARIWEYLIEKYQETVPVLETAIKNLYICYEELKRFDDCVKLFVDSFFHNNFIIDKIEVQSLLKKIKENRFKVVSPNIELPIFYTIVSADENETHTAFERFNFSFGVCKPSELIPSFDKLESHKIIFYLKHTCGAEILKHSIHINGSKERLEERLAICKFLIDKDAEDKTFYDDEIKSITNILIIQKGLLELDESKIYVNEQGIISNELKECEAIYSRFKNIAKIADKSKIWLLDKRGRLTTLTYTEESTLSEKVEYSSNPVYDIYKELFDEIKEKFLHSKFGIVAYLSTRIRHGVLLGEIRPIFEKHKLITQKEGETSTYKKNQHWENMYPYESNLSKGKIQTLLKDFSYSIDGLIFDLIKKYLQVLDKEKNPDAWFDYDFEDEDLYWFSIRAIKTKDFNQFAKDVFEILWEKTDQNLNLIREKIQNDIAKQFNELFDCLEKDMVELLGANTAQSIVTEIKACSTETQTVIRRVSSWFKRSGTQTSDFQLNNLVDIVMEHSNKTHQNKRINLDRQMDFNCTIKGEFYTHFADLLRIFFENILKHADDKVLIINSKITTSSIDNYLTITIENNVTNAASIEALKNVWGAETMNVSKLLSEGKSGFHKANKIVKSDFKNDTNSLFTALDESEVVFTVGAKISLSEITT